MIKRQLLSSVRLSCLGIGAVILLLLATAAHADPELVKDIRPGAAASSPLELTEIGGTLFFRADDGANGYELWKSDGTADGTVLVKDIIPGASSSDLNDLTPFGGALFFQATDGANGYELWKSDGTAGGTVLVKDIKPGAGDGAPGDFGVAGGRLFFTADDGVNGFELWKSDGTAGGTVLVKDIKPGPGGTEMSNFTDVGGTLFFSAGAFTLTDGAELWKSDGTAGGTVLVKDINPGAADSGPRDITDFGGTAFFNAFDSINGQEFWRSDGTEAGTVRINIGPGASFARSFTEFGGTVFFAASDDVHGNTELFKTDGTEAGTLLVKDINPGAVDSSPVNFTEVGGTLFFRADDGVHGRELWKTDGTADGTVLVKDINPGAGNSDPEELTEVGGKLFFRANDGTNGRELWQSNGTEAGTVLVADINPDAAESLPSELTKVGNTLFFSANDGVGGEELWKLDVPLDADGDGIFDDVDELPNTPSNRFSDLPQGGSTSGRIISAAAGLTVQIEDHPTDGVLVTVLDPGATGGSARIGVDGKTGNVSLVAGTYAVTDPVATMTVSTIEGEATIEYEVDGAPVVIVIGPGEIASVTETTDEDGNLIGVEIEAVEGTITVNGDPLEPGEELGLGQLSGHFSAGNAGFSFNGVLTLSPGSDGVGPPLTESVQLSVGTWSATIPAAAFKKDKMGRFKFTGTIGGVRLELVVGPLGSAITVRATGRRAGFTTFAAPIDVIEFGIGNDVGVMGI